MYGWLETKFVEDRISMFLPKAGRLRVSLHCRQYWDYVTVRDGRASFVLDPPFVKCLIRMNEEALLGWWGFGKGVGHVSAKDQQVFGCRDGIKETRTGLVDTICIHFGKYTNHTQTGGPITYASGFLAAIDGFNPIRPHQMEDGILLSHSNRFAKHSLCIVLIKLEVFRALPIRPIILVEKLFACETHGTTDVV